MGVTVWAVASALFTIALFAVAFYTAMDFRGVPIDGPFQLYNAMRRIQAGFRPGIDFQFFHGLGSAYLYYPFYRLFGGGLEGSELARELGAALAYPIVYLAAFRILTGNWRTAWCLTALALAVSFISGFSASFFALAFAVNGMLGIRSALPTLLPASLLLARTRTQRALVAGVTIGLALFISTEQGLAAILSYGIVSAVAIARRRDWRAQLGESAATIGLSVLILIICLVAVAGFGGMRGALRYNFSTVPADQYWFFGAPPNVFLSSWRTAFSMVVRVWHIGLALLLGVALTIFYLTRLWRSPSGAADQRRFSFALLAVYGLVSCASLLGVFVQVYVQPCWRAILILLSIELYERTRSADERQSRRPWLGVPRPVAIVTAAATIWSIAMSPLLQVSLASSFPSIITEYLFGNAHFRAEAEWPNDLKEGQRIIDGHRGPRGETPMLWSTYAGWLEAQNGIFNPSTDYIIHALGTEGRARYVSQFRTLRPPLAQTVLPTYAQYEPWLENNDWPFYDELLRSYVVAGKTSWSLFWSRRAAPGPEPHAFAEMNVPAGMAGVALPPIPPEYVAPVMLLEVDIDYDTKNPLHWIPVVGQSPRYLVGIQGAVSWLPISLNPFVHHIRFPLVMRQGQQPRLFFETMGLLPGANYVPTRLRVSARAVDSTNTLWLNNLVERLEKR
ncbi:MAG TPA: glycosyltransferase family 87 protein [Gemmatimonadaceae bacterium]|nr:glycosyltransferase family 87 protein [Gemmatimonadaceae bacterium]